MTGTDLAAVVLMALAVYLPKAVPLLAVSDRMPAPLRRWLGYVAPAVLAALVAPSVLAPHRALEPPTLVQVPFVATFGVALLTRRMLPAVGAGVLVLLGVTVLGGR